MAKVNFSIFLFFAASLLLGGELDGLAAYGEVESYFAGKGSTNAFYEAMDIMKSRHAFDFSPEYKKAVAAHFAEITNINATVKPSWLYRTQALAAKIFGPKKLFAKPPDKLKNKLDKKVSWKETYAPKWLRVVKNVESLSLPDGRHCEIIRQKKGNGKALLFCHGGGMILPPMLQHWDLALYFLSKGERDVWFPDYPLLPDTDMYRSTTTCFEAYREMLKIYKPEDIAFFGDSAGCALCLTVCFRARDNKLPLPSRLFLFSPAHIDVSEENCKEEMAILAPDDILIPLQLIDNLNVFLRPGPNATHNECDPYHGDLEGFPPMHIFTGSKEVFSSHATRFYELAKRKGIDATFFIGKGVMHDWILMPVGKESLEVRRIIADKLKNDKIENK